MSALIDDILERIHLEGRDEAKKVMYDEKRLLRYWDKMWIKINSVGFSFVSGKAVVLQSPRFDKKTLERIFMGLVKINEEQCVFNYTEDSQTIEFREKYINLGSGNIETLEIRYCIPRYCIKKTEKID